VSAITEARTRLPARRGSPVLQIAGTHHQIHVALGEGAHEPRDLCRVVLPVAVGPDHDVIAGAQGVAEAGLLGPPHTDVVGKVERDHAELVRQPRGAVA
jgi:hypothetical protein